MRQYIGGLKEVAMVVWLAVCGCVATAQEMPSCVKAEANVLHYDSTSTTMRLLREKWQRVAETGSGNVSVVHIGSSHVQAGVLPNTVRCNIMAAHPDLVGGRGMIFPYSAAAKCNNPSDYRIHCPQPVALTRNVYKEHDHKLGVCGIAVTAMDVPTEMQVVMNEPRVDYRTSSVILVGHTEQGLVPRLRVNEREIFPSYIDQPTDRYIFQMEEVTDSFVLILPCREGDSFTVGGIYLDNGAAGYSYHSIGVNGASLNDYLRCENFVRDLRLLHPDLVIFGIGINDAVPTNFDTAAFRQNYLALVDSVRAVNPDCAMVFITNNDSYRKVGRRKYSVNNNGPLAREAFYRIAEEVGGGVWDQYEVMGGLKSMDKWYRAGLARADRIHFTAAGYRIVGDLLSEALIGALEQKKR